MRLGLLFSMCRSGRRRSGRLSSSPTVILLIGGLVESTVLVNLDARCATLFVLCPSDFGFDCEGSFRGVFSEYIARSISKKLKQYFCE